MTTKHCPTCTCFADDPGPPKCSCGWPLTVCGAGDDGLVPEGYDYSRDPQKPHPGDPCPKRTGLGGE